MSSLCAAIVRCPVGPLVNKNNMLHVGTEALFFNRNQKYPKDLRQNLLSIWEKAQSFLQEYKTRSHSTAFEHKTSDYYQCLDPEKLSELFKNALLTLMPLLDDKELNQLFVECAKNNDLNSLKHLAQNYHKRITQDTLLETLEKCTNMEISGFILTEFEISLETTCRAIKSFKLKALELIVGHFFKDYNDFLVHLLKLGKIKEFEILIEKILDLNPYFLSKISNKLAASISIDEILQIRLKCKSPNTKSFLEIPLDVACSAIKYLDKVWIEEYLNIECDQDVKTLLLNLIDNNKLDELQMFLDNFFIDKTAINFCTEYCSKNGKLDALRLLESQNARELFA